MLVEYSAVQYSAVQSSAVQCIALQCAMGEWHKFALREIGCQKINPKLIKSCFDPPSVCDSRGKEGQQR